MSGQWMSGDFYGGVVYNMDFKSGAWHGGILEDIQIIGFGNDGVGENYFTLNGIFKFNSFLLKKIFLERLYKEC